MNVLLAIGGAGGILAFATAVVVIGRGIFRQVNATDDNTAAIRELSSEVGRLTRQFNGHETRIAVLEDRQGGRRAPRG